MANMTRRRLLASGGAAMAAALPSHAAARPAAGGRTLTLEARPGSARLGLAEAGRVTPIWGYGGVTPGPILRVAQGAEFAVRLRNRLPQPTTIHWHGLRLVNAMDGVAHLTQAPVAPGATFDYRFTCPDAGTFWYHPHLHEGEQLARGLAGVLIVEEHAGPQVDHDLAIAIQDWRLDDRGRLDEPSFRDLADVAHEGRIGNLLTANGTTALAWSVRRHARVRLRLVNMANARVLRLALERAQPKIIAIDGQPIGPREIYVGGFELPPGGRMDLMLDAVGAEGSEVALVETSYQRIVLARLVVAAGEPRRASALTAPIALAPNPVSEPDGADPLVVDLTMGGGAQGRLPDGRWAPLAGPLPQHGHAHVWSMNGALVDGHHGPRLFEVARGRTVHVRLLNDTVWPHAMHVHGHHFRIVARSGDTELDPYWWDTLLLARAEAATIAFKADNPGKWMLHCHMLEHQLSGMMTWFEVT